MKSKNTIFLASLIVVLTLLPLTVKAQNPIVYRLSDDEINENKTPSAVAYNFVRCILNSRYSAMLGYMDRRTRQRYEEMRQTLTTKDFDEYFSQPGKYNIHGWKSLLSQGGYEVAVLYVQDEQWDNYEYAVKKVYIDCIPSSEIGYAGFQGVTRSGETNIKVLLSYQNGNWKVIGFK